MEDALNISEKLMPCGLKFHNFSIKAGDTTISCEVIVLEDSLYIWIGDSANPNMDDLSFALMVKSDKQPVATKIMGSAADLTSTNMASRLSMKLGKPVYVSFNVKTTDNITLPTIEKGIHEEFQTHADILSS
ncbi:hypothetical protein HN011_001034 [Eciton burchellii]|jgi:hypothetical protein|nr:hypothetical protein HN011_001034 [Eciton burchellii]